METKGTHHTDRQHECGDEEVHARYKEVIEQLRETKNVNDRERMIKTHFADLTPEEQVVLREVASAKSYRDLAREKFGPSATADRWTEIKKNLQYKLKH
jgi:DNA-binding NarL/FixJ family response regulator